MKNRINTFTLDDLETPGVTAGGFAIGIQWVPRTATRVKSFQLRAFKTTPGGAVSYVGTMLQVQPSAAGNVYQGLEGLDTLFMAVPTPGRGANYLFGPSQGKYEVDLIFNPGNVDLSFSIDAATAAGDTVRFSFVMEHEPYINESGKPFYNG